MSKPRRGDGTDNNVEQRSTTTYSTPSNF